MIGHAPSIPHYVGQENLIPGANTIFQLRSLPEDQDGRVTAIRSMTLKVTLSIDSAATSDAIAAGQALDALPALTLYDRSQRPWFDQQIPAYFWKHAYRELFKRPASMFNNTAVSADSNTTNTLTFDVEIPFSCPLLVNPDDTAQLVAQFTDGRLEINVAAATIFGTGQTVNGSATSTAKLYLNLIKLGGAPEARPRLHLFREQLQSWDNQWVDPRGALLSLGLAKDDVVDVFVNTDFTSVEMKAGGTHLLNTIAPTDLAELADNTTGFAASLYNVVQGGDYQPLLWTNKGVRLSHLPAYNRINMRFGHGSINLTDQELMALTIRPVDRARWARTVAQSPVARGVDDRRLLAGLTSPNATVKGLSGKRRMHQIPPRLRPVMPAVPHIG